MPKTEPMPDCSGELAYFRRLVLERTGLDAGNKDDAALHGIVSPRLKAVGASGLQAYAERLEQETPAAAAEWEHLVVALTAEESYFFRDRGQLGAIRSFLLPDLFERARGERTLRMWSAGCCRGEEPYSIAIIVRELVPDADDWDIRILATDINGQALAQAERGLYAAWSLRGVEPALRNRYFTSCKDGSVGAAWRLEDRIRQCVTFHRDDLFRNAVPLPWTESGAFDLILCRNVFIYFERNAVARILSRLTRALRPGGYLITGHGELFDQRTEGLELRKLPETVAYRRSVAAPPPVTAEQPSPLPSPPQRPPARKTPAPADGRKKKADLHRMELDAAREDMRRHDYARATERVEGVLADEPRHFQALFLKARLNADTGDYEEAWRCARLACEIEPFAFAPYHLMAHLSEVAGDFEAAKDYLKNAIYLEPSLTAAYLDLAGIFEHQGDPGRADKFRSTAWGLLQAMPADSPVAPYEGVTVKQLRAHLREVLGYD